MQRKAYSLLAVAISAALTGQVMADTPERVSLFSRSRAAG